MMNPSGQKQPRQNALALCIAAAGTKSLTCKEALAQKVNGDQATWDTLPSCLNSQGRRGASATMLVAAVAAAASNHHPPDSLTVEVPAWPRTHTSSRTSLQAVRRGVLACISFVVCHAFSSPPPPHAPYVPNRTHVQHTGEASSQPPRLGPPLPSSHVRAAGA